jgi:hypothetical protein
MGLFDKAKAYMTGSHAKVTIEHPQVGFPSQPIAVKIHASATLDFEFGGVFIDVIATEEVEVKNPSGQGEIRESHNTYTAEIRVAQAGSMKKDEQQTWTGAVILPPTVQASYTGKNAKHKVQLRGRLETKGNDPDSGFQDIRIGAMS